MHGYMVENLQFLRIGSKLNLYLCSYAEDFISRDAEGRMDTLLCQLSPSEYEKGFLTMHPIPILIRIQHYVLVEIRGVSK